MKTLKTFFVLLAMVVTCSSYAQTKEETIEWLHRNGKDFLFVECDYIVNRDEDVTSKYSIELINNDTLRIKHYQIFRGIFNGYFDVPFSSILYQDVNTVQIIDHKNCPQIKAFVVKNTGSTEVYTIDGKETRKSSEGDLYIRYDKANEENAKRALKAIMHLAKLSGAKENKQTF